MEFEFFALDPARLKGRQSFRVLQHEEKMRNVQEKLLPDLEKRLVKEVGRGLQYISMKVCASAGEVCIYGLCVSAGEVGERAWAVQGLWRPVLRV